MEHIVSILKETYRNIERNLDRKRFKNLWENNGNIYDFYELAKDVYYKTFKKNYLLKIGIKLGNTEPYYMKIIK